MCIRDRDKVEATVERLTTEHKRRENAQLMDQIRAAEAMKANFDKILITVESECANL